MACIDILDFPALPPISPFTIAPPSLPAVDLTIDFCCRLNLFTFTPALPLGVLIVAIPGASAVILAINASLEVIDEYLDAIPPVCPRQ
jgi:hypothetical protein